MSAQEDGSSLPKSDPGAHALDQLTGLGFGGVRTTLLLGPAESGKTTFAVQAIVAGAQRGEPAIFVSFDENPALLRTNALSFGWDLRALEQQRLLAIFARVRPRASSTGRLSLQSLLSGLAAAARDIGARRVVFDGLHVLMALIHHDAPEAEEILRLRDWLFEHSLSGFFTACTDLGESDVAGKYALLACLADCVVKLETYAKDGALARRLRVLKYRGAGLESAEFRFTIGKSGLDVLVPPPAAEDDPDQTGCADLELSQTGDVEQARRELASRLRALDEFLEIKQAEMDFLLDRQHPPKPVDPEEFDHRGRSTEQP